MHDADNDFKNSLFKVIGYVKYEFQFFVVLKLLTGRWSVGRWPVVSWSVGKWSVVGGRLVGVFKQTREILSLVSIFLSYLKKNNAHS